MPALALGLGIPFTRRMGAGIDAQAQAHYNRVIADGGLIPSGLVGVNNFFTTVKGIYGTSDITTAISVGLDAQVLGYKLGAGAGTTAGQAAQKLYSCSGSSGDVVQTTAASQPLLLVHSGANYWFSSGVSGNYCSTPNSTANNFGGAIDIKVLIKPNILGVAGALVNNAEGQGGNGYSLQLTSSDNLRFGTATFGVNSTVSLANTNEIWVRVTSTGNLGTITFYTSTDGINWISGGTATDQTRGASSSQLGIGALNNGNFAFNGAILRATISNSIGGTPVVDFNPNQYNAANSQTQWTSSTGEIWSLNVGTATTGYKGQIVTKTIVQGDGIDDNLRAASFSINLPAVTSYMATRKYQNTAVGILYELGADAGSSSGIATAINDGANRNAGTIFGNTANGKGYSSTNILNQLITCVGDTSQPANDEVLYFENNVQLAINITFANGNNTANINQSVLNVFSRNAASLFANVILNTFIIARQADNSTNRTAVYNYIKSINGNSF